MRQAVPGARSTRWIVIAALAFGAIVAPTSAPRAQPSAIVDVDVDTSGATTRVILKHSRRLVYAVTTFEGRVEVVYADPVAFRPTAADPGDGLLERWIVRGDRTLVLTTGPGFEGFDYFELRNPFRLIVDLKGDRAVRRAQPEPPPKVDRTRQVGRPIVVVDPGHGGVEDGAIGPGGIREKDVALDIARRLRTALANEDVTVVLTRDGDRLVELDERTAIANHNRADLFVSIHLNASRRVDAHGAETYFLSTEATDDEARKLAGIENASALTADNGDIAPELRERGLDMVLWDLAQNRHLAESALLAESVQRELNVLTGTRDRGVRQAPFRVLVGATMPAILVEVGFITNPDEAVQFGEPRYRDRVADALSRAVRGYFDELRRERRPSSSFEIVQPVVEDTTAIESR